MFMRDITAQDVATALGCHRETVYRWMQNRTSISDHYSYKLLAYLDCTASELLTIERK